MKIKKNYTFITIVNTSSLYALSRNGSGLSSKSLLTWFLSIKSPIGIGAIITYKLQNNS